MPITMSFELSDSDLEHFRQMMKAAVAHSRTLDPEIVVAKARETVDQMQQADAHDFAKERIANISALIDALQDEEWQVPEDERQEILTSLAYFSEPHDLVPDSIPVLGYIDDAIMIELVLNEMSQDLDAYKQFCDYRSSKEAELGDEANINRDSWLEAKRSHLHAELRRRKYSRIRGRLFG